MDILSYIIGLMNGEKSGNTEGVIVEIDGDKYTYLDSKDDGNIEIKEG